MVSAVEHVEAVQYVAAAVAVHHVHVNLREQMLQLHASGNESRGEVTCSPSACAASIMAFSSSGLPVAAGISMNHWGWGWVWWWRGNGRGGSGRWGGIVPQRLLGAK